MMTEVAVSNEIKRSWYNNYIFPLLPIFETRKANEYNTSSFTFHWLFFKMWTLDSFGFEFAFVADDHWGIGFVGILPYLRWIIAIPCPTKFQIWAQKNLWRKVPQQKRN